MGGWQERMKERQEEEGWKGWMAGRLEAGRQLGGPKSTTQKLSSRFPTRPWYQAGAVVQMDVLGWERRQETLHLPGPGFPHLRQPNILLALNSEADVFYLSLIHLKAFAKM